MALTPQAEQKLEDLLSGNHSIGTKYKGDVDEFIKNLKGFSDEIKRGTPGFKQFNQILTGHVEPLKDIQSQLHRFEEAIEDETEALKKFRQGLELTADEQKAVANEGKLTAARNKMVGDAALRNMFQTATNIASIQFNAYMDFSKYAIQFSGEVMKMNEAVETFSNNAIRAAEKQVEIKQKYSEIASGLGFFAFTLGKVNKLFWVLGAALEFFAAQQAIEANADKLQIERDKVLKDATLDVIKGYKELAKNNIVLADGMTGLYNKALKYGVAPAVFAQGLNSAKEDLMNMGMGTEAATSKISEFGEGLRKSKNPIFHELYNLGYSFEEQVGIMTNSMAQLQSINKLYGATQEDVANAMYNYGKSLKVIEQITGKNAKEQMAQARQASMDAYLRSKLTGEQLLAFQQVMAATPESQKRGQIEMLYTKLETGVGYVIDAATNVNMALNQGQGQYLEKTTSLILNANAENMGQVLKQHALDLQKLGADTEEANKRNSSVLFAAAIAPGKNANLDALKKSRDEMTEVTTRLGKDAENIKNIFKDVEKSAENINAFDKAVYDANEQLRDMAVKNHQTIASIDTMTNKVGTILTEMNGYDNPLNILTDATTRAAGALNDFADRLGMSKKGKDFLEENGTKIAGAGLAVASLVSMFGSGGALTPLAGSGFVAGLGLMGMDTKAVSKWAGPLTGSKNSPGLSSNSANAPGAGLVAPAFGQTNGQVGTGGVDPRVNDAIATLRANPKFSNIIVSGGNEYGHHPGSAHERGMAVDFTLPPELAPKNARESAQIMAELKGVLGSKQFRLMKDEYTYPDAYTKGGHIHGEYQQGGDIPSGKRGIVGDGGIEFADGPAHVTSVDDTRAIFKKIADNIQKLVEMNKNDERLDDILAALNSGIRTNQKILTAVS